MKTSDVGLRFVSQMEGLRTRIYRDQAGLPTIGVGHLLTRDEVSSGTITLTDGRTVKIDRDISQYEAIELLRDDIAKAEAVVNAVDVAFEQHQFDAVVSLVFNIGVGAFTRSTLLKKLESADFHAVPDEFRKWTKITKDGRKLVSRGLTKRREAEIQMWLGTATQPPNQQEVQPMFSEYLRGKKTFLTASVMVVIGAAEVAGYQIPGFDAANAGQLITDGLGFFFVRMGINQ